jgi:hypothetical protein
VPHTSRVSGLFVYFAHIRLIGFDYWEQFESIQRLPQILPLLVLGCCTQRKETLDRSLATSLRIADGLSDQLECGGALGSRSACRCPKTICGGPTGILSQSWKMDFLWQSNCRLSQVVRLTPSVPCLLCLRRSLDSQGWLKTMPQIVEHYGRYVRLGRAVLLNCSPSPYLRVFVSADLTQHLWSH